MGNDWLANRATSAASWSCLSYASFFPVYFTTAVLIENMYTILCSNLLSESLPWHPNCLALITRHTPLCFSSPTLHHRQISPTLQWAPHHLLCCGFPFMLTWAWILFQKDPNQQRLCCGFPFMLTWAWILFQKDPNQHRLCCGFPFMITWAWILSRKDPNQHHIERS